MTIPEQQTIIGGWRLVSFENQDGDGRVRLPYGPAPVGYILYTREGRMSATIMRGDRTPLAGEPRRGEAVAEKARLRGISLLRGALHFPRRSGDPPRRG